VKGKAMAQLVAEQGAAMLCCAWRPGRSRVGCAAVLWDHQHERMVWYGAALY
jgi:hypothetical protein